MLNILGVSSYVWQYLSQMEMLLSLMTMLIAFLIAFHKRKAFWRWIFKSNQRPNNHDEVFHEDFIDEAEGCQGLVLILGRIDQMMWLVEQLNPTYIHAISTKTEAYRKAAVDFQESLIANGKDVQLSLVDTADNKNEISNTVIQAVERLKKHGLDRIIVDVTGGTKPMGIGAYEAAKLSGAVASYISTPFEKTAKPIHGETKIVKL